MSIGEIQARIGQIQSLMLAVGAAPTSAARGVAAGTAVSGAAGGTSATTFAAALNAAVVANGPTAATSSTGTAGVGAAPVTGPVVAPIARPPAPEVTPVRPPVNRPAVGWIKPLNGPVTSGFGPRWGTMHEGMDIAAGTGTPVRAAAGGVVKKASWYGGYGKAVIIDHGKGVKTLYAHNSKLNVKVGDRVQAGEVISKVGSTGDSTGPHLHFEVQVHGKAVNPRPWLKKRGVTF